MLSMRIQRGKRFFGRGMGCRSLVLWPVIVFATTTARSQDTQYHPVPKINIDSVEQADAAGPEGLSGRKDMVDWLHGITHAKPGARRDLSAWHLSFVPAAGYSLQTGLAGVLSANLGFYTGAGHNATDKISSILTSVT